MTYSYPNGYAAVHTPETIARLNDPKRGAGRVKIRWDIILRDGEMTVVHHDLTRKELARVREEIEAQGNQLW